MYADRQGKNALGPAEGDMVARRRRCEAIAAKARHQGFDVTWERVNRHYAWFTRWDEGRLATGYLIRRTGIKRKEVKPAEKSAQSIAIGLAHGTRSQYVKGCRCRPCTDANARYSILQRWASKGVTVEWPPGNPQAVTPRTRKEPPGNEHTGKSGAGA